MATRQDIANYQAHYLDFAFKWEVLTGDSVELFDGPHALPHARAHPGIDGAPPLPASGAFYFASDHLSFRENFTDDQPPGWLMRDHDLWQESTRRIRRLVEACHATVVYGHDPVIFDSVAPAPAVHE